MTFFGNPDFYRRRAAVYDSMVGSPLYNRVAWGTKPEQFVEFAARAFGSADGPLLEVAAGTASATKVLHVASRRTTTLVDAAAPMLQIAERAIAVAAGGTVPERIHFECRDMLEPASGTRYQTILGLGLLHLVDDVPRLIDALLDQLSPGGTLFLSSLFRGSRRSAAYLSLLHRSGEVVTPRSLEELRQEVSRSSASSARITSEGSMAYVEVSRE
ncbi:methyltransferase domain-containing protein [Arthrobacter sp. JZ12]|uniref:methyltransferase domain-containing protein n=1 Tax=Arthrobacter sp. JZ12 TaxID=2654190 RepID=UPI002B45B2A6|nr:methyltransferase domain-containing protein [Arthrobacter sp. JZ12]WRH26183.1 methyltransferase domain-containing protein [Arthrobacter sp. JZ12]